MLDHCTYCGEKIHWCYDCEDDDHNADNPKRIVKSNETGDIEYFHANCLAYLDPCWRINYLEVE